MTATPRFRWALAVLAVLLSVAPRARATDVTIALVTIEEGKSVSLEPRQAVWKSPYGGWVVAAWPFGSRLGDATLFEYRTAEELLAAATDPATAKKPAVGEDLLDEIKGEKDEARSGDLQGFRLNRRAQVTLDLPAGRHVLQPFGIEFTVAVNGALASRDVRVRVDSKAGRVEVVCRPVVLKTFAENRSAAGPLRLSCGNSPLLNGLDKLLAEFQSKSAAAVGTRAPSGFRRLTLYLPASTSGQDYDVNGVRFTLDADGRVTLAKTDQARCDDGREIRLLAPADPVIATRPLGIRWLGLSKEVAIACGDESVSARTESGSASLSVPSDGLRTIMLGTQPLRLPAADPRRPHELLVLNIAEGTSWLIRTGTLSAKPGSEWACQVTTLTPNTPSLPKTLAVTLTPSGSDAVGETVQLASRGSGEFAGLLPKSAGLWQIHGAPESPLAGQPLGLVQVADAPPRASVSLYTHHNRALVRRGDAVDLFWSVKRAAGAPAVDAPIVLRGRGLETPIGRIRASQTDDGAGGSFRLDTAALSPGDYEATVTAAGAAVYPLRFRVVQREPVTDFELYSHVFGLARPAGGSPINAYYGSAIPVAEPGLAPFLAETSGALDPAFASYATASAGPALEKCVPPSPEEAALMALAGLGMRWVPGIPALLHHEDWNPKHTLHDELGTLRRRLALFTQTHADAPSFAGVSLNWFATRTGYWEESLPLDGNQARRNAEMNKWIAAQVEERVAEARDAGLDGPQLETLQSRAVQEFTNQVLPRAYAEYLADARRIRPDLTAHSAIPSFWFNQFYPPTAFSTLTQRDAVDYTDYGVSPWGNFRAPAFLNMGNLRGQKLLCNFMTAGRHSRIAAAFGGAGRGLDGLSLQLDSPYPQGEDAALLRIFERFGSYFSALEPLPDVAVYFNGWQQQKSVILHDLARLRRPGMLLAPEDVLAGKLPQYKVLILAAVGEGEPAEVLAAFREFEARGGVILKDGLCHTSVPGRDLGLAYDQAQLHDGWGLAWPDGEWEFAHLWSNYQKTREQPLRAAFARIPGLPVTTPDDGVVISPLAGKESICCFVINQTLVPLSVEGKWRQHAVLPRHSELLVEQGWHVRDLLAGTATPGEQAQGGRRVPLDFTRMEGGVYLLTKREPQTMGLRTVRTAPHMLRLTAWLAAADDQPLADPLPFEVTLTGPDGDVLFHKFAALSPELGLDVPVPVLPGETQLQLQVHDLVLGRTAVQSVTPTPITMLTATEEADLVGGPAAITGFLDRRIGPVTILLDESQTAFRPAAVAMQALLEKAGREAEIKVLDPAEVRPLPLRWTPNADDQRIVAGLPEGKAFASRVSLSAVESRDKKSIDFADPRCGYAEYGPRLRIDGDVVLFGTPETHLALAELAPYLRRTPSRSCPAPGGFFLHPLLSPFQGGFDGLYVGCHDPVGAAAAVTRLAQLADDRTASSPVAQRPQTKASPVVSRLEDTTRLENLVAGKFGTRLLDVAYSPSGDRLFVTADSYGDSLFVLDPAGELLEQRALHNRSGNSLWWRSGGRLRPVDDATLRVSLWNSEYRYSLDDGWLSQSVSPPTGFTGRFSLPVAAPTLLEDAARGQAYLGGARNVRVLDPEGRLLWTYDDDVLRTSTEDLLDPRSLFPRGVTGDGRVLLVAGFGIKHDVYGLGTAVNASVLGLDAAGGKLLWQRDGLLLNQGKVIPLDDRFLVVDDQGAARVLLAATGEEAGRLRPVGATDWILPIPGREELLIVENNAFDRAGPTSRVYVRPLSDDSDRPLAVPGRVTDVVVAPDGLTVAVATERGATLQFSIDGALLWRAETPSGGIVRLSPDGGSVLVGARDGVLHWLDRQDGLSVRTRDFNVDNVTDGARFIAQSEMLKDVPLDQGLTIPADPPEPSYLTTLNPKKVAFGKNLIPDARLKAQWQTAELAAGDPAQPAAVGQLAPNASFTLRVEAGRTYLVELLAAAAEPDRLTPHTRLEIAVQGKSKSANLPYVGRLPLSRFLTRRRAAFRADSAGDVTLTLRAVEPRRVGDDQQPKWTYEQAAASDAGLLAADVVVAELNIGGRNLIFDGGPQAGGDASQPGDVGLGAPARKKPAGDLICQVKPWTGGNSTLRHEPYPCAQMALRLVDGVVANQDAVWTTSARGLGIDFAEGRVRFKTPQEVRAIVVYEDNSGPFAHAKGVSETTATHYAVYVHEAVSKQWRRIGHVIDNTQLVNVFECPPAALDEIRYVWAGRNDVERTDGLVRMSELEVFSADDLSGILDGDETDLLDRTP